jgi:Flp pilus assembly protein TadG
MKKLQTDSLSGLSETGVPPAVPAFQFALQNRACSMKNRLKAFLTQPARDQGGQVLPWMAVMLFAFVGIAAFVVDLGHAFVCYQQLQAATDAAALAGALNLKSSNATSVAAIYGATSGAFNNNSDLGTVTMVSGYPMLKCLTTVENLGMACIAPNNANAIVVEEQAVIPTFFSRVFGVSQIAISTVSTGAIAGSRAVPLNVVVIVDTTESMNTYDSNCGNTRIACSLAGLATLLQNLSPCTASTGNCNADPTTGVATNPLDQVALFTFPNIVSTTVSYDTDCSGKTSPTTDPYTFPAINGTSYSGTSYTSGSGRSATTITDTYEVTNFLSNYRASDSSSSLIANSPLANATGSAGCANPTQAPGGAGTYYAGVIYAAQGALAQMFSNEKGSTLNPQPQNIMIILTDGEANSTKFNSAANAAGNPAYSTTSGTYPSSLDQCQQAVAAAAYAKSQGTIVYTVAYGSESSGCTTDTTNSSPINIRNITPCQVMSMMASSANTFYSDYNQSGSGSSCQSTGNSQTNLNDIFTAISADFLTVRLVPNGSV